MTKEELEQYRSLLIEVELLEKRIRNLSSKRQHIEHGFVKGSNPDFPYEPKNFHVSGYNALSEEKTELRIRQLTIMLEKKKTECEEQLLKIQEYIDRIPDSKARAAYTMIFINGMNQTDVGRKLHMDQSTVSRLLNKYLEKSKLA